MAKQTGGFGADSVTRYSLQDTERLVRRSHAGHIKGKIPKGWHDYRKKYTAIFNPIGVKYREDIVRMLPGAAQPQPNFLYESGEIASEKALAMTATMHFDGTRHVVIASEAKQSFPHKKRHILKGVCEKTYKKSNNLVF